MLVCEQRRANVMSSRPEKEPRTAHDVSLLVHVTTDGLELHERRALQLTVDSRILHVFCFEECNQLGVGTQGRIITCSKIAPSAPRTPCP